MLLRRGGAASAARKALRYPHGVMNVLVATASDGVLDDLEAAIAGPDATLLRVRNGRDVRPVVVELRPDLVVLDMQIGTMGGVATALDLRLDADPETADVPILLLMDREHDQHLAREVEIDGWIVKPLDPLVVNSTIAEIMENLNSTTAAHGVDDAGADSVDEVPVEA